MRKPLRRHADDLIRLEAPVDEGADPAVPIISATVTARIFDIGKDSILSVGEASAATVLRVNSARRFDVGDVLRVEQDSSFFAVGSVQSVDLASGSITISGGLTASAAIGSRVARQLGPDIACSSYNSGAANLLTTNWGFQGEKTHDHLDLRRGQNVRIEITLDDGAGRVTLESFETVVE